MLTDFRNPTGPYCLISHYLVFAFASTSKAVTLSPHSVCLIPTHHQYWVTVSKMFLQTTPFIKTASEFPFVCSLSFL